ATDAGDAAPSLTFADVTTPGTCPQGYSVTRTWTAKDCTGNTSTSSQTINVVDTTAPVISTLPGPSTIQSPATPSFATPTATDAGDAAPSLTLDRKSTPLNCSHVSSSYAVWTSKKNTGNTSTRSQTINVVDTTAPVISTLTGP